MIIATVVIFAILITIDAEQNEESAQQLGESAGGLAETTRPFVDLLTEPSILITILIVVAMVYGIEMFHQKNAEEKMKEFTMTFDQLVPILHQMACTSTPSDNKKCNVILFGIHYAEAIEGLEKCKREALAEDSGAKHETELSHAARHLSKYVELTAPVIEAIEQVQYQVQHEVERADYAKSHMIGPCNVPSTASLELPEGGE